MWEATHPKSKEGTKIVHLNIGNFEGKGNKIKIITKEVLPNDDDDYIGQFQTERPKVARIAINIGEVLSIMIFFGAVLS